SGRASPVSSDTSVDLPAPLRPTSACASPGATSMPTSIRARVAPKLLDTAIAVATGRPVVPAALWSCVVIGRSLAHLVAPQRGVVHVRRGHQRRGQLVLQAVGQLDDRRVVVGRAGGEGLALGRG